MGASLVVQQWRICLQCRRHRFDPWVRKIPWRRAWQPTPVSLPGEAPWTEEPGGLQSTGSQSVRHDLATTPQPTDERGDSLHRQLVTCCPDIPLPLSAEVTTTWKCCWHRNPTSAPRPAPPQSLSGPHWAYLSAFSDGCPLDTPRSQKAKTEKQNRCEKLGKRRSYRSAKAQRWTVRLLLQVKGAPTLPQLILHFREGAQWSVNICRRKKDWYRQWAQAQPRGV